MSETSSSAGLAVDSEAAMAVETSIKRSNKNGLGNETVEDIKRLSPHMFRRRLGEISRLPVNIRFPIYLNYITLYGVSDNLFYRSIAKVPMSRAETIDMSKALFRGCRKDETCDLIAMYISRFPNHPAEVKLRGVGFKNGKIFFKYTSRSGTPKSLSSSISHVRKIMCAIAAGRPRS
jgi:hypothetical protein